MPFQRFSVCVDYPTYERIKTICHNSGRSVADVTRELIQKGLASEWAEENTDLIAQIVKQQMEAALKPHVERLAALESKTGHAASTAMFLTVQAFMDLLPPEKRKIPKEMYEKARKKAVEYMRTPLEFWNAEEEL